MQTQGVKERCKGSARELGAGAGCESRACQARQSRRWTARQGTSRASACFGSRLCPKPFARQAARTRGSAPLRSAPPAWHLNGCDDCALGSASGVSARCTYGLRNGCEAQRHVLFGNERDLKRAARRRCQRGCGCRLWRKTHRCTCGRTVNCATHGVPMRPTASTGGSRCAHAKLVRGQSVSARARACVCVCVRACVPVCV